MKNSSLNTRRDFIRGMLALGGSSAAGLLLPRALTAASFPLGDSELLLLSDGNLSQPLSFVVPASVDQQEASAFLENNNIKGETLTPDCNITLWRHNDKLVIFDVGAGSNFMPTAGKLGDSLAEAGIDPSEVTDVVFTHAHPDHLWGLLDDFDDLLFADADYHMSEAEWGYWRADDTMDKTPDARKSFVAGAQNRCALIEDRIQLFRPGQEVLPGIEAVDTSGHTPGHTSFALHQGSDSVMVVGDAITNIDISFKKPHWPSGSDQDQEKGRETRLQLLDRLASDKSAMVGFHLPHPGLGQVEARGDHFAFVVS